MNLSIYLSMFLSIYSSITMMALEIMPREACKRSALFKILRVGERGGVTGVFAVGCRVYQVRKILRRPSTKPVYWRSR